MKWDEKALVVGKSYAEAQTHASAPMCGLRLDQLSPLGGRGGGQVVRRGTASELAPLSWNGGSHIR